VCSSDLFTSIVTNDALLICLAAMCFHSLILTRRGMGGAGRQVMTGLLMAGAVWAKMSGLVLLPLAWFAVPRGAATGERWAGRVRVLFVAIIVIAPLVAWNQAHYGSPVPFTPVNMPEETLGVKGGAVFHPLMAVKIWLRTAASPLDAVWGPLVERLVSLTWVVLWGGLTAVGWLTLMRTERKDYLLPAMIAFAMLGFVFYNVTRFQVEFRLLGPAFPALAVLASVGAGSARLKPLTQALLWLAPLVLLAGYGLSPGSHF
jgi:4-amino-4-deoxy-L-arabinose transferase-like glycosyltransferase